MWLIIEPVLAISLPFLLSYGQVIEKPGILASLLLCCWAAFAEKHYTNTGRRERKAYADSERATREEMSPICEAIGNETANV